MTHSLSRSWRLIAHVLGAFALANLVGCSSDDDTPRGAEDELGIEQRAELDEWIEAALERYSIPGAAVAIVRGPKVLYERGFGMRELTDGTPVGLDTRFLVGSVTKGMTSLLAATLVDAGKLGWDEPVVDVLPAFELASADSTQRMRVRHLLNHSNGVARQDTQLFIEPLLPTQMVASLRTIPIVAPPGETYIYHNQMVATGGFVAALADGATYDDSLERGYVEAMQAHVLQPIGMDRTTFDFAGALADPNRALPHAFSSTDGSVAEVPVEMDGAMRTTLPAGGAWSSISDLAAYASTQLSGVAPNGTRVVSEANLEETHTKAVDALIEGEGEGYAMGWHTQVSYLGMRALWHDGDTMGTTSQVLLLPEANLGIVVLANRAVGQAFYRAVQRFAAETVLAREHATDADDVTANAEVLSAAQAAAGSGQGVSREEAQPYLGDYGHGVRVRFTERGFLLTTAFGDTPLLSLGDPGVFACGGVLTASCFSALFDTDAQPVRLQLDLLFNPAQPFDLERQSD
jgi:CubicO group peptidase (beta-lactamase class C family)